VNWLDRTRLVELDPRDVDFEDRTYYVPCFESLDLLVRSIAQVGMLNAPVVQERPGGTPVPVLGRRRLQATRQMGLFSVKVRALPLDMPVADGFRLAFWDNIAHRHIDPAFRAVLVRRLLEIFPKEAVAGEFLEPLGIPPKGPRLERLRAIGGLDEPVLQALATGRIQEKSAAVLVYMQPEDRKTLLDLSDNLKLNANKTADVISALWDLSVLHGKSVREWLSDEQVSTLINDSAQALPERAERFRQLVRVWKFPELVEKERHFREWRDRVASLENISIVPSPGFEDEGCVVRISATSWKEAEEIVGVVGRARSV